MAAKWLKRVVPKPIRTVLLRLGFVLGGGPIIEKPTYADDGLISQHVVAFMDNLKFINAYNLGKQTGALDNHPGDIHFRAYTACWAAKHALKLDGDFVECGVGKGLLSKTIVSYLEFQHVKQHFYLFDTFKGIPVNQSTQDERVNIEFLNDRHFSQQYLGSVTDAFAEYTNVHLVAGVVPESLRTVEIQAVAFLSIDMNNASAEVAALEYFWDKIVFGGIVLLDDYAYGREFLSQKAALDKLADEFDFEILTLATGQGLIIKNAPVQQSGDSALVSRA